MVALLAVSERDTEGCVDRVHQSSSKRSLLALALSMQLPSTLT